MREKLIYEGYMQMNPKYKTPFYAEHVKRIEQEKIKKEQLELTKPTY